MIGDAFQRFAQAQAMTGAGNFASLGASTPFFYPFPQPAALNVSALDLLVARDRGQGWP